MALTGLKDDYTEDGRVLTEDLSINPGKTKQGQFQNLAACYKQLNSSVGEFGTDMIVAETAALKSGSATDDSSYENTLSQIKSLGSKRDALATQIKTALFDAEFNDTTVKAGGNLVNQCQDLVKQADSLSAAS
jgi:hypothetical protein